MKDFNSGDTWVTTPERAQESALNLRRLLYFHHQTAREAARVIGVTDQAVSGWLAAKRGMTPRTLFRIADIYEIDPRALNGDPLDFAAILGDRERVVKAEQNIDAIKKKLHRKIRDEDRAKKRGATVTKLQPRRKS